MPCPKCNSTRLFTYEHITCPNCDKIKIVDTPSQIYQRKIALEKAKKDFEKKAQSADLNKIFSDALERRELIAEKITKDPWTYGKDIVNWCALSYLLCKCSPLCNSSKTRNEFTENLDSLMKISIEIIKLKNEIDKLEKNQAKITQIDDKLEFCLTEDFPLSFVPKDVEREMKKIAGATSKGFDQWLRGAKRENVETILTQALAMYPAIEHHKVRDNKSPIETLI
jgi:hypothetical protein